MFLIFLRMDPPKRIPVFFCDRVGLSLLAYYIEGKINFYVEEKLFFLIFFIYLKWSNLML